MEFIRQAAHSRIITTAQRWPDSRPAAALIFTSCVATAPLTQQHTPPGVTAAAATGVDLVAYSSRRGHAVTIQVKSNWKPKPGGGKGKKALDWWIRDDSPADILAFVNLEWNRVWLVKKSEVAAIAQQHSSGRFHFFISVDPTVKKRTDGKAVHAYEFERYLLENRVHELT